MIRTHHLRTFRDRTTPRTAVVVLEGVAPCRSPEMGCLSDGPSVRRERLGNLLRFAGVGINFVADHAQCYLMKIGLQSTVEFNEFGPHNLIDKALWRADHDGVAPLAMKAIGPEPVTSAESEKQMARPLVRHRELHLDRRM